MKAANDGLSLSLRAISDPVRREILRLLSHKELASQHDGPGMCVSDLQQQIGLAQSTISHHVRVLTEAGLVRGEKFGTWMRYRRDEAALQELAHELGRQLQSAT